MCGYSKEPSRWQGSFEHPKHMFKLMDMKIIAILRKLFFLNWSYVQRGAVWSGFIVFASMIKSSLKYTRMQQMYEADDIFRTKAADHQMIPQIDVNGQLTEMSTQ